MTATYVFFVAVGLVAGAMLGFALATMITVRRNIQDIHNKVCPEAGRKRKRTLIQ